MACDVTKCCSSGVAAAALVMLLMYASCQWALVQEV
jgi:hypothetical protein